MCGVFMLLLAFAAGATMCVECSATHSDKLRACRGVYDNCKGKTSSSLDYCKCLSNYAACTGAVSCEGPEMDGVKAEQAELCTETTNTLWEGCCSDTPRFYNYRKTIAYMGGDTCVPGDDKWINYVRDLCHVGDVLGHCVNDTTVECVDNVPHVVSNLRVRMSRCVDPTVGTTLFVGNKQCIPLQGDTYSKVDCELGRYWVSCSKHCFGCIGDGIPVSQACARYEAGSDEYWDLTGFSITCTPSPPTPPSTPTPPFCKEGSNRCPCLDGACISGLQCVGGRCVALDPTNASVSSGHRKAATGYFAIYATISIVSLF